ncbi:MAG: hypothetical protein F6K32_17880 [Desertifilum sp. SIO1I2]|nr:hypothetical protein [Desertifilum sp. SIO1I2]
MLTKINLPDSLALEFYDESSDEGNKNYLVCGLSHGQRNWIEKPFTSLEKAVSGSLLWLVKREKQTLANTFVNQMQVTLLLIYLYIKPDRSNISEEDVVAEINCDEEEDEFGRMYGPLGDYAVLDALQLMGYVSHVSNRRSRWAEIILTYEGARVAQQLEAFWNDQQKPGKGTLFELS